LLLVLASALAIKHLDRTIGSIQSQVETSTNDVMNSARDVSQISEAISDSTTATNTFLIQSMTTLTHIGEKFRLTQDVAKDSAALSVETRNGSRTSSDAVREICEAMNRIDHSNKNLLDGIQGWASEVGEIRDIFGKIQSKTSLINDIVFQSKLLSFNASIEAARSGEHGKGFAVVAEEVGKLTRMTGALSLEISQLLETSTQQVDKVVGNVSTMTAKLKIDATKALEDGLNKASMGTAQIGSIVTQAQKMEINGAQILVQITEQNDSFQEITDAMKKLLELSKNSYSRATQGKEVAGTLLQSAGGMDHAVKELHEFLHGDKEFQEKLPIAAPDCVDDDILEYPKAS